MIALESADSVRFLYRHFLSKVTEKSLNAFYYACSYAKVDYSRFMNVTASTALKLIPNGLRPQPVFLCIDDTMAAKFGKKFESVSKLFDHAAHNGLNYLEAANRSQLLRTKIFLILMQVYGTERKRHRNDREPDQYSLLQHEIAAIH